METSQTAKDLKNYIERIERLEEEKSGISADIREVYKAAQIVGFEPKIMRQVIRLRKMRSEERDEMEAKLDTYMAALAKSLAAA